METPKAEEVTPQVAGDNSKPVSTAAETPATDEAFSYTQRDEFTSEIYKIEIRNLGIFGVQELRKLLVRLKLDFVKIKSPHKRDFAFVTFRNEEKQQEAVTTLNGMKWKGRTLETSLAKASADPFILKRQAQTASEGDGNGPAAKRPRTVAEATCPLAEMPYEDQLTLKKERLTAVLQRLTSQLIRSSPHLAATHDFKKALELQKVMASPVINAYRNKCEFTVGYNGAKEVVVGFRLGSYVSGSVEVNEVVDLPHIPESAKQAAASLQLFLRSTEYEPFDPVTHKGCFKQLMVRVSAASGKAMLVVGVDERNIDLEADRSRLHNKLKTFYQEYSTRVQWLASLYYSSGGNKLHLLWGEPSIEDSLLGNRFQYGPLSFFQVNTAAAEVLYRSAVEMAAVTPETIVFDICCGIGTIGLCFAKHCKQVYGVEIVKEAIEYAELNATLNGATNTKFYAGNAEQYINSVTREVTYSQAIGQSLDLLAILDPPRAGMSDRTISYIRGSNIKRLLYISCEVSKAMKNLVDLCRPTSKAYKGVPFVPKMVKAVDLFPHTEHVELLVLFERATEDTAKPKEAAAGDGAAAAEVSAANGGD